MKSDLKKFIDDTIDYIKTNFDTNDEYEYEIISQSRINDITEAKIQVVEKNDRHYGMSVRAEAAYDEGASVEEFAEYMWKSMTQRKLQTNTKKDVDFIIQNIGDISKYRDRIFGMLVNTEFNKKYLRDFPYTQITDDLAVIYKISVNDELSMPIGNNMLKSMNITKDELHDICMHNLGNADIHLYDMCEIILITPMGQAIVNDIINSTNCDETTAKQLALKHIRMMNSGSPIPSMYIVTTSTKMNGAIGILRKDIMDEAMRLMNTNELLVIPSSVHEALVMPYDEHTEDIDETREVIKCVNHDNLSKDEWLSDHPYIYSSLGLVSCS